MINKAKQKSDVLGVINNCIRFSECPLCYGCRNYSTSYIDCESCAADKKKNVCNVSVHAAKNISNFITKTKINLDGN